MLPDNSKKHIAFLALLFLVPFLTELLSGNIPYPRFFDPVVFGYLVVMYGFPVLLIRELYSAKNLSLGGLIVLGLAYGVLNEGVAARTLLLFDEHMFMTSLRGYETFGINLPWATMILPWHALFSIVYPIMLVHAAYPATARERWLSKRVCIALAAAVVILGSLSHFGTELYPATSPVYLPVFWVLIIGLTIIALRMKAIPSETSEDNTSGTGVLPAFFFGVSLIGLMIIPLVLPELGIPEVSQLITTILLLVVAGRFYVRHFSASVTALVWIAFGHYLIFSLFAVFKLWPISLVGAVIVWLILGVFWWTIRCNTTRAADTPPPQVDSR